MEVVSRYLSCPECNTGDWQVEIEAGGTYPAFVVFHCCYCGYKVDKYWLSEDWRDLETLGTFDTPKPKPTGKSVIKERRAKGWLEKHGY
ncbi:MAG: hypothetical protein JRN68_06650 [Nitrososphaerota archaeon]|nr:hypothetical protein [Nitrososphaerota archaeon]